MDIQLKKGFLEFCVLASLVQKDSYGYQIIKDTSEYIEISESTLYPILKRLEGND
ncbi:MAG: PadR family transcriptional regulator, partial [Coprobacillus sp.]